MGGGWAMERQRQGLVSEGGLGEFLKVSILMGSSVFDTSHCKNCAVWEVRVEGCISKTSLAHLA